MIIVFSFSIGIILGFILSLLIKIKDDNQESVVNYKNTSDILNMHNSIEMMIQNKNLSTNDKFINIMQTIECDYLGLTACSNEIYLKFIDKLYELKKDKDYEKENAGLKEQIEKMKADVKQGQSYWNSGEMQYDLYQRLLDK